MLVMRAQANRGGASFPIPTHVSKPMPRNQIVDGYTTAMSSRAHNLAAAALTVTARPQLLK
jgi:hypothetical protein